MIFIQHGFSFHTISSNSDSSMSMRSLHPSANHVFFVLFSLMWSLVCQSVLIQTSFRCAYAWLHNLRNKLKHTTCTTLTLTHVHHTTSLRKQLQHMYYASKQLAIALVSSCLICCSLFVDDHDLQLIQFLFDREQPWTFHNIVHLEISTNAMNTYNMCCYWQLIRPLLIRHWLS